MRTFRKIQTRDIDVMSLQNNVEQVLNPLAKLPILDGTFLTSIVLTTNALKVPHDLHRQPLGWIVTDQDTNSVVYRTGWTDTTITLQSSATCLVNVWIF